MKISLILGVAAVAAVGYYLTTPAGKAFTKKVCSDAEGLKDDVTAFADSIVGKGKDLFGKAKDAAGTVAGA